MVEVNDGTGEWGRGRVVARIGRRDGGRGLSLSNGGVARRGGEVAGSLNTEDSGRDQGTRGVWACCPAFTCHIQISFQSLFHRNLPPFGPSIGLISSAPLRFPRARPPPQSPRRLPAARPISANPMPRVFSIRTHPTHLYQHRVLFTISGARAGRWMQLQSKLSAT